MFKLTYNLAVPVGTVIGTAELNTPLGKDKWFLPVVTRANAIEVLECYNTVATSNYVISIRVASS